MPKGERKSLEDVLEETRSSARWIPYFEDHRDPYLHLGPAEYRSLLERCYLSVQDLRVADKLWDFESRDGFVHFGQVTFVAWTSRLPEAERPGFITDVLDRYREVACHGPGEENVFRFYQMDVRAVAA